MTPSNPLEWLASLPLEVAVVMLYVPALIVTAIGTLLVRWLFEDAVTSQSNVAPTKAQSTAQIYSTLLGFLVVMAYTQYDDVRTSVRLEVENLRLVQRVAGQFAPPVREGIDLAVSGYARAVVDDEWRRMAFGGESASADAALDALFAALPKAEGGTTPSAALAEDRVRQLLGNVAAARVERVSAAPDPRVADLLSGVLALMSALSIAIAWFLRGPSVLVHLLLGGILVTTFLSLILLSVELIYPFAGDLAIPSDEFRRLII